MEGLTSQGHLEIRAYESAISSLLSLKAEALNIIIVLIDMIYLLGLIINVTPERSTT